MMGALTSSHARALTKLPRGNQGEVARVIASYRLSSRQSELVVVLGEDTAALLGLTFALIAVVL